MKLKIQSIFRKLRHHQFFLLLALLFVSVNTAKAEQLYFSYSDPVADQTGSVDVTEMNFLFDTDTGNYTVILSAAPDAPFLGQFRVNVNLYNPDVLPAYSYFQDTFNEFDLSTATYRIKLTGTNPSLQYWAMGHRVRRIIRRE